jgi:thioredoxin-related protein
MNFKFFNTIFLILILSFAVNAQKKKDEKPAEIKWYSFEDAINLNAQQFPKKKILIDVYTDWCGWCKKMDATTFSNPEIVKYINEYYYAVKLNAERKDSIMLDGKLFINPNPTVNRSTHQLAEALLNNRMSYPSYVFMDEMNRPITVVPGYSEAVNFEPILHYFADNQYLKQAWETFQKQFVGKVEKK